MQNNDSSHEEQRPGAVRRGLTEHGERIPPIEGDVPCGDYDPAGPGAGVEDDGEPQCANCGYSKRLHGAGGGAGPAEQSGAHGLKPRQGLGAVNGSAALQWSEELPRAAGWWLWDDGGAIAVEIWSRDDIELWATFEDQCEWLQDLEGEGRWLGPFESEGAAIAAMPQNAASERQPESNGE